MVRTVVYDAPAVQTQYASLIRQSRPGLVAPRHRRKARITAQAAAVAVPPAGIPPASVPPPEAAAPAPAAQLAQPAQDTIPTKLVKYVPVEVVSVSAAGFAAFNPTGNWIWFGLTAGAVVNVLYLFAAAVKGLGDGTPRPRLYFYALSALAFVVWAIATIGPVQNAMHLSVDKAAYILVAGAFGIPLLDTFFGVFDVGLTWPKPQGLPTG